MIKALKNVFRKLETRQTLPGDRIPFRQSDQILAARTYYENHPIVSLAIRLYTDILCAYDFKIIDRDHNKIDHPLLSVLQKPNNWQSQTAWLAQLAKNVLLGGQQCHVLRFDKSGQVESILPFLYPTQCWAYRRQSGDFSDPTTIEKRDYFYMANGKYYNPDEILAIKDLIFPNYADLLNGYPRLSVSNSSIQAGLSMTESLKEINRSQLISPDIFSAPESFDSEKKKEFVKATDSFWEQDIGTRKRTKIYPPGFSRLQNTKDGSISSLVPDLKKISDLDVARTFGIHYLLHNYNSGPQSGLKEIFRNWHNSVSLPWLKHIANQLSCGLLTDLDRQRGLRIAFNSGVLTSLDKREVATYLGTLFEKGVINQNEARDQINFMPVEGGDQFKPMGKEYPSTEDPLSTDTEDDDSEDDDKPEKEQDIGNY